MVYSKPFTILQWYVTFIYCFAHHFFSVHSPVYRSSPTNYIPTHLQNPTRSEREPSVWNCDKRESSTSRTKCEAQLAINSSVLPDGERERWNVWVKRPVTAAMVKQMGRWTCQLGDWVLPCWTSLVFAYWSWIWWLLIGMVLRLTCYYYMSTHPNAIT